MITFIKRILHIFVGVVFCFLVPVGIKEFVLKPVRFHVLGNGWAGQVFQWGLSLLLILAGYILFVRILEKREVCELSIERLLPDSAKGILWGVFSISLILVVLFVFGAFKLEGLSPETYRYQLFVMILLLAATEEILYRGILYRLIEKWYGTFTALFISSVLFSLFHLGNNHFNLISFVAIISGGAIMGLLFSLTKSLWLPVAAHFSWNATQIFFGLRLSGTDDFSDAAVFTSDLQGNPLITGGDFGMENSLVTIIYTMVVAVVLALVLYRKAGVSLEVPLSDACSAVYEDN